MARDLAIPPVAVQPVVNSGRGSSVDHQHQDEGDVHVGPPSPDRVERSSSEDSDDLDDGEEGEEEAEEGEELYRQFLARRMAEERLLDDGVSSVDARQGERNRRRRPGRIEGESSLRQTGRVEVREDLATLAERFARSEGRQAVRRRAEQVELCSITQDNFSQLLSELFHDGGITQERILVLFFFCSDLALRALRAGLRATLSKLTRWSVAFLRGTVAAWVRCKGGWNNLLSGKTNRQQVLLLGASLALVCLWVVYKRHR